MEGMWIWAGCAVCQVWKESLIDPLVQRAQRAKNDAQNNRYLPDAELVASMKVGFIKMLWRSHNIFLHHSQICVHTAASTFLLQIPTASAQGYCSWRWTPTSSPADDGWHGGDQACHGCWQLQGQCVRLISQTIQTNAIGLLKSYNARNVFLRMCAYTSMFLYTYI